jgi:hypothetical protein
MRTPLSLYLADNVYEHFETSKSKFNQVVNGFGRYVACVLGLIENVINL